MHIVFLIMFVFGMLGLLIAAYKGRSLLLGFIGGSFSCLGTLAWIGLIPKKSILFESAIPIARPWIISEQVFKSVEKNQVSVLTIHVGYDKKEKAICPICQKPCEILKVIPIQSQHLNFFEYPCFINAEVPVVSCQEHGEQKVILPWATGDQAYSDKFLEINNI